VARKIVDTVGAGDAFLPVTSPLVAAGMPMISSVRRQCSRRAQGGDRRHRRAVTRLR